MPVMFFRGLPWFNLFGGGKKDLKLMSMMGYDAMCLGNHEFDNGPGGLCRSGSQQQIFLFLCANYRVEGYSSCTIRPSVYY
jgi:5'-nucleotidase